MNSRGAFARASGEPGGGVGGCTVEEEVSVAAGFAVTGGGAGFEDAADAPEDTAGTTEEAGGAMFGRATGAVVAGEVEAGGGDGEATGDSAAEFTGSDASLRSSFWTSF
ncbi:MAG: hypothetical protein WB562_01205 [Candidatus Sulfotelmatobacter sp.]